VPWAVIEAKAAAQSKIVAIRYFTQGIQPQATPRKMIANAADVRHRIDELLHVPPLPQARTTNHSQ
jgi:hypothetical protein